MPACDKEMKNHADLGTWELVSIRDKPKHCKLLAMKMFGKAKRGPNGEVKEFKERACVRGDQCTESQRGDSSAAVPSTRCTDQFCATGVPPRGL